MSLIEVLYIGDIVIKLGDSTKESYKLCKEYKPNLIIISPPYSVLALRWIDLDDIEKNIDTAIVDTLSEIDKRSLGGKNYNISNNQDMYFLTLSSTLKEQIKEISEIDNGKVNKILNFYNDFYKFIKSIECVLPNTYIVMTVGNRTVAKKKIKMDEMLKELFLYCNFDFIYKFERNILNKRMPAINHFDKKTGTKSKTMTKEYVLILKKR